VVLERCEQPNDLFFSRLESSSQAVMGRALDESLRHKMAIRPGFRKDVHILLLQTGGENEVLFPAENAGGLRTLNVFSAAKGYEVCSLRNEVSQILPWRELSCGVDNDRNVSPVCNVGDGRQRQSQLSHTC